MSSEAEQIAQRQAKLAELVALGVTPYPNQFSRTATVSASRESRVLRISGEDFLASLTDAPASTALLEGARSRLARTHPGQRPPVLPLPGARTWEGATDRAASAPE